MRSGVGGVGVGVSGVGGVGVVGVGVVVDGVGGGGVGGVVVVVFVVFLCCWLLTLFFEQVFAAQLRFEPGKDDIYKVLFLMDEFESLGTMEGIVDKLPFVRSFNIRIMAIIQGLSQLDQRYTVAGRDKILQGSKHQIFFSLINLF